MPAIKSIRYRKILNSHVSFTNEFIIELYNGAIGSGASPQGETISIYEDKKVTIDPVKIIEQIRRDDILGKDLDQSKFDAYLQQHIPFFGRNNVYGLSLSFFNAISQVDSPEVIFGKTPSTMSAPLLCLNILNGGWHAYTNPVLSDFSEFMLVAKSNNLEEVIRDHNEIQNQVKDRLLRQTKTVVSGNPVNSFSTADNRECIDFLLDVCERSGVTDRFDLMIDASAGDLWSDNGYRLAITNNSFYTSEQFVAYWTELAKQYNLRFLEDPFREKDFESWHNMTTAQKECYIIGDNLYSSDKDRIESGIKNELTHGLIMKPNQAGTTTAVAESIAAAEGGGQIIITSHRSISTESTFISLLTCLFNIKYIKIGPLMTDYSSVIRLNEIIRLTEA